MHYVEKIDSVIKEYHHLFKYALLRARLKGIVSLLNTFFMYKLRIPVSFQRLARLQYGIKPDLFKIINIQTQTECNYNCSFCPNKKVKRPRGAMSLELYKKIIRELAQLNFTGFIEPFLMNESFMDPRLPRLIKIALRECPGATVVIQTNGSLLTDEFLKKIKSPRVIVVVNDYTSEGRVLKRISGFNNAGNIILLERKHEMTDLSNMGGLIYDISEPMDNFCIKPFTQFYVGFDGRVCLCCQDWQFTEIMGNVRKNSIKEIWYNNKYTIFRKNLLNSRRIGLCSNCDYYGVE